MRTANTVTEANPLSHATDAWNIAGFVLVLVVPWWLVLGYWSPGAGDHDSPRIQEDLLQRICFASCLAAPSFFPSRIARRVIRRRPSKNETLTLPAWLAEKGKDDKAKKSLRRLVGNVDGYDVDYEYGCIKAEVDQSKALLAAKTDNGWKALFKGSNLKRALISTIPFTFQNVVGVPLVYGNTTYFFQTAGLQDAFLGSLIISIIGIVA